MRILYLTDRWSHRGGADWHLVGVVHEMIRRGHQVHLGAGRLEASVPAGVLAQEVPALGAKEEPTAGQKAELQAWTRQVAPQLLHLQNVMTPWVLTWAADHPSSVATVQDHRVFCPGRGKWHASGEVCSRPFNSHQCRACLPDPEYRSRLLRLTQSRLDALKNFAAVVVLSHYMKGELVAAGLFSDRVHVIPPFVFGFGPRPLAVGGRGATLARAPNADGEATDAAATDAPVTDAPVTDAAVDTSSPCLLFVGRLVQAKAPEVALEAWRQSGLELPLILAGTGPLRGPLEKAGAQVTGWLDRQTLARLYQRARVLLFPSWWQEPFGIVGLEAHLWGVPVVAWDSGGIGEWCPPQGLVRRGDVAQMAARARALAHQRARPPLMTPPEFCQEPLMDRLTELYGMVASR